MEINSFQVGQTFASKSDELEVNNIQSKISPPELSEDLNLQAKVTESFADNQAVQQNTNLGQIEDAVTQISEFVQSSSRRQLNFSVDEDSNKQVVKVTDAESGDVIRQIPSEEVLKLSERLQDLQADVGTAVGLLFNKQV
ncbi:flagellar protein FlaG [Paraglaciecola sp. 2405UD69-4]|uniref:flagellar protein FlaG n=1 Tax=Paraglaciecola sp. 2405UD69-4 TaxID=3391836 RepID=UPI0039C8DA53